MIPRAEYAVRYLLFCPYFPMRNPVEFADWELGPVQSFEDRWADPQFKAQATAFMGHFVPGSGISDHELCA